jgi:hypothetical protein
VHCLGAFGHSRKVSAPVGNQCRAGDAEEEAMRGERPDLSQRTGELGRVGYCLNRTVEDPVALVGRHGVASTRDRSKRGPPPERLEVGACQLGAEWNDLDRQRKATELLDGFGGVADDENEAGGRGDDAFAQQRGAAPFDQVEAGTDLIRTVHGHVERQADVEPA